MRAQRSSVPDGAFFGRAFKRLEVVRGGLRQAEELPDQVLGRPKRDGQAARLDFYAGREIGCAPLQIVDRDGDRDLGAGAVEPDALELLGEVLLPLPLELEPAALPH